MFFKFPGKNLLFTLILMTTMIPGEVVVITNYVTIQNMDLTNTYLGLVFPSLISGTAITHQAGSPDVVISQPGIYQATFHGAVSPDAGTAIPAEVTLRLYLDGSPVPGGVAHHTFASSTEVATLTFSTPFRVTSTPASLEVRAEESGFTAGDIALTVLRLGD